MKWVIFFCRLAGIGLLLSAATAHSATFTIADGDVSGLTAAITTANGNGQNDIIELAGSGTYTLSSALPALGSDGGHQLAIHGNGATIARSSANGTPNFRLFTILPNSNITLVALTLTNGSTIFHGGAIYNCFNPDAVPNPTTTLTITGCTLNSNTSDYGGAIFNDGGIDTPGTAILVITNSTISNNTGTQYGGGVWSENGSSGGHTVLYVNNCTFSGNSAIARSAGAIQHDGFTGNATGTIINSTFTQNSAHNYGGAINVDGSGGFGPGLNGSATLDIINCTFDQNTATGSNSGWGGAIALDGSDGTGGSTGNAQVNVDSCTFSGNFSGLLGDAIYLSETTSGTTILQIGNSILASADPAGDYDISTDNLSGGTVTVTSKGFNLSDDAACGVDPCGDPATGPGGLLNQPGDQRNTDPLFDPAGLKFNGGLTPNIALQATSPALDHGKKNTIFGVDADQRSEPRPFDDSAVTNGAGSDGSDIGAYEADVRILSSARVGNDFQISFTTILGHNYEIQGRTSLLPPANWMTVNNTTPAPPIAGTGGVVQVTVPNAFGFTLAFYRVHQLP